VTPQQYSLIPFGTMRPNVDPVPAGTGGELDHAFRGRVGNACALAMRDMAGSAAAPAGSMQKLTARAGPRN